MPKTKKAITGKPWIQVHKPGQDVDGFFNYAEPASHIWDLKSGAHHLSLINRYTGATKAAYSVAEHSFRVMLYAVDLARKYIPRVKGEVLKQVARQGLLHDLPEMVVGDVNSPLKSMPFMKGFKKFEKVLHKTVNAQFGLGDPTFILVNGVSHDVVRAADLTALELERRVMLNRPPAEWQPFEIPPVLKDSKAFGAVGLGWDAEFAESTFLGSCYELGLLT